MRWSAPRYWMVAVACLMMMATLSVEYVRLVYPTQDTDTLGVKGLQPRITSKSNVISFSLRLLENTSPPLTSTFRDETHMHKTTHDLRPTEHSETLPDDENENPSSNSIDGDQQFFKPRSVDRVSDNRGAIDHKPRNHFTAEDLHKQQDAHTPHYDLHLSQKQSKRRGDHRRKVGRSNSQDPGPHYQHSVKKPDVYKEPNDIDRADQRWQLTSDSVVDIQDGLNQSLVNDHPSHYIRQDEKDRAWKRYLKKKSFHAHISNAVTISNDLLHLQGFTLPPSPSLKDRGFQKWQNSSEIVSHLPDLLEAVQQVMLDLEPRGVRERNAIQKATVRSLNPNIVARGNFQQEQVNRFCHRHYMSSQLPSSPEELSHLFSHLLYDDSKKVVFCYVPKNGCSNMKRLLLILNGILPPESAHETRPSEEVLKRVKSFKDLSSEEAVYKLHNYYKFAIVRHPLERLLSAYRNKLEHPVVYEQYKHFPANVQLFIMSLWRPGHVHTWLDSHTKPGNSSQTKDIFPSFPEFVNYMQKFPLHHYNEHFSPFSELCQPCAIQYDLYTNFKSMQYDLYAVLDYLSIPASYYPSVGSNQGTRLLMKDYYKQVAWMAKKGLFSVFRHELELYYSLYPEETNSHKEL